MTASERPRQRQLSHKRSIDICSFRRSDGLYDIEAHLVDVKGIPLSTPDRLHIAVGEELHNLTLCLTINSSMTISAVRASMEKTPYLSCTDITHAYQGLVGITIGAGWSRHIKTLFAGVKGCTHLRELLGPLATVAYQTVVDEECRTKDYRESAETFAAMVGSCHGLDPKGENVPRLWPELIASKQG